MALQFPLSASQFADRLKITEVVWRLQFQQEHSGLGSGEVLTVDLAPPLWMADVALAPAYHEDAAEIQALIESLDGSINAFYLHNPARPFPRADPAGSRLGNAAPAILSVGGDNKTLALKGLPAGYSLSAGDFLAFDYATNPIRRALHRVIVGGIANASGTIPTLEIRPHFRPGVKPEIKVSLIRPAAKCILVPGSFEPGSAGVRITSGMAFKAVQTLR